MESITKYSKEYSGRFRVGNGIYVNIGFSSGTCAKHVTARFFDEHQLDLVGKLDDVCCEDDSKNLLEGRLQENGKAESIIKS